MSVCDDVKKAFPEMKLWTELSSADLTERGFLICAKYDKYWKGPHCEGIYCGVELKDCKDRGRLVGSFHTHPTLFGEKGDFFSADDFSRALERDQKFACIGYMDGEKAKLRCASTDIPREIRPESPWMHKLSAAHIGSKRYDDGRIYLRKHYTEMPPQEAERRLADLKKEYRKMREQLRALEINPCEAEL